MARATNYLMRSGLPAGRGLFAGKRGSFFSSFPQVVLVLFLLYIFLNLKHAPVQGACFLLSFFLVHIGPKVSLK